MAHEVGHERYRATPTGGGKEIAAGRGAAGTVTSMHLHEALRSKIVWVPLLLAQAGYLWGAVLAIRQGGTARDFGIVVGTIALGATALLLGLLALGPRRSRGQD